MQKTYETLKETFKTFFMSLVWSLAYLSMFLSHWKVIVEIGMKEDALHVHYRVVNYYKIWIWK